MDNNTQDTISKVATWAYICKELAKVDPIDYSYDTCFVCYEYLRNRYTEVSAHKESCAWRQAQEFVSK